MDSTSVDNLDQKVLDEKRADLSLSPSSEPKEKKKTFFLTKSLAEVYAKQGHILMALEIYKRMQETNPADSDLVNRISELESHLSIRRGIKSKEQDA